jgi:hypothetical protein
MIHKVSRRIKQFDAITIVSLEYAAAGHEDGQELTRLYGYTDWYFILSWSRPEHSILHKKRKTGRERHKEELSLNSVS